MKCSYCEQKFKVGLKKRGENFLLYAEGYVDHLEEEHGIENIQEKLEKLDGH